MKTKAQIQAEIRKLTKIAQKPGPQSDVSKTAYEAWHALRWVIETVDWTPAGNCLAWTSTNENHEDREASQTD